VSDPLLDAWSDKFQTHFDIIEELIPTEPSTPIKFSTPDCTIPSPIPIISPPIFVNPPVILSAETIAKLRLGKYKEREGRTADYDYARSLQVVDKPWSGSLREWEILLGLGQRTRRRRIDWLLQVCKPNFSWNYIYALGSYYPGTIHIVHPVLSRQRPLLFRPVLFHPLTSQWKV
jgi:hypothetical protein